MNNIKKILYASILGLCMTIMIGCSDGESYDFPGDPYNRVYMRDASSTYKIVQTPIATVSNLNFETVLKCTRRASKHIKASVEIDNSLIGTYNEKNGTEYEAIPEEALILQNTLINILEGSLISADTLRITMTKDKSILANLTNPKGYLIPLRITTVEGKEAQPSSIFFSSYITVTVTDDNVNHDASESSITGTLVSDQTKWTVTTNGIVSSRRYPIKNLFDNDMTTYSNIRSTDTAENITLDINMHDTYMFDAITLYYARSYWDRQIGSLEKGMSIYTSNDGITWQLSGKITDNYSKICVFYVPITAQYIRIVKPKNYNNISLSAGLFNIYAK